MSNAHDPNKKKRLEDLVWMRQHLDPKDIEREPQLLTVRWFDYRFISPLQATELFVREYQKRYRAEYAIAVDREKAGDVDGVRLEQLYNDPAMRTQIWRARQRADETGMPYSEYLDASFTFASRRSVHEVGGRTKRRMLLSVSQLHHPDKAAAAWKDFRVAYWTERLDMRSVMPAAPAYRNEYFDNLPAQVDFRDQMTRIAAVSSSSPKGWMEHFAHIRQQIPIEAFKEALGEAVYECQVEQLRSDIRHWGTVAEPLPTLGNTDTWQSCFGLLPKQIGTSAECSACSQSDRCSKMAGAVKTWLSKTGSIDPVRDHKLSLQRERQRRSRAKQAAAMQPVPASVL